MTRHDVNLYTRDRWYRLDDNVRYKEESRSWFRRVVLRSKGPSASFLAFEEALRLHHLYEIAVYEAQQALLKRKRSYWESLDGYAFERATAEVLNKHQFNARVTRGSADGGVDIEVSRIDRKGVVQCKAHVACVGRHVVRDLYGVIHHSGASFGIIVSRAGFTKGAEDFARDKPILFLDTDDLIAMQEGRDVLAKARTITTCDEVKDLNQALAIGKVRGDDLARLIMEYFNLAQHDGDDIVYCRQGEQPAIHLHYAGEQLTGATAGPGLDTATLDKISKRVQSDLLQEQSPVVGQAILFASVPVTGHCTIDDILQILPAPADAPRPPQPLADHPFLIEFKYTPSPVDVFRYRYQRALVDWALVLNILLHGGARMFPRWSRHHWTLVPGPTEGELHSEYLQEGYSVRGLSWSLTGFNSVGSVPAMAIVSDESYYGRLGISANQALDVPECLPGYVIGFSKLESQIRDKFLRCAYWFYQSGAAWTNSVSLSFVCLVSAIEALLPPHPAAVPCPSCGKDTNPSLTRRFRDFLDNIVPSLATIAPHARNELYRVRSKLSHGETLLRMDEVIGVFNPRSVEEDKLVRQAHSIVRTAALNWLSEAIAP